MEFLLQQKDYKSFLRELIYGPASKRGMQTQMAKAMGCQAAYLSQALKGKAELSEDHAMKLARYLGLSTLETEYFLLLVRMSRAATPELKSYLEARRQEILEDHQDASKRVQHRRSSLSESELGIYFSSWIPSTVHISTSSEKLQTVDGISKRLSLEPRRVKEVLEFLRDVNLVTENKGKWEFSGAPLHFDKKSALNTGHQLARRQQVIRSIEQNDPNDLHFASVFTLSEETFKKLRRQLLDFVERSHKEIHSSGTDDVYAMSLDLFRVV